MIEWSETDLMMRDAIREFINKEVRPHIDELEHGDMPPYDLLRKLFTSFGIDVMARETVTKMLDKQRAREAAVAAGEAPPAKDATKKSGERRTSGGFGGGQESLGAILCSELCGVSMGMFAAMGVSLGLGAATIQARGTLAQKERWLPPLVTMEKVAAWALTEPDSGSDAFGGMKTSVKRDGDDYLLNGQKTFITNGPYADTVIVYAKLDEKDGTPPRDRKVLTFVLDKGMEGFTQSRPMRKMGLHSSPTGELFFDNVRLGRDRLLGETEDHEGGDGRQSAKEGFVVERMGVAAMALGVINECRRLCIEYAKDRKLWGTPIADLQLIQLKLAKMEVARVNVQNMVFQGIEMGRAGKMPSLAEASAMKWYASEAATEVAMDAVQLFGGNGYMSEYRVEQLARDAKSLMIYAGSNEVQITHVAKGLLGK
ncbi:acyl-CoA dehydrogenase family protein [Hoyosella subflava]|uniref:Putative acyl-CoA dehydrogenase n=1 Tax=Hoyosella subflava (strain DSM 45089 / JCM 17490 / NBRC 109087 / DQS3-9A1) TaxID=443218 RepID=F6EJJ3_HOYSD|nr:acyl-CoA dehydrogenase family protein [Hoyosella subflava]AEF39042.1 Putative acyl-CoA dehydrogenase [Hoyosella subflava DQS3-9A1]